ncbi:unnamed protein product [Diamesa tonsa]
MSNNFTGSCLKKLVTTTIKPGIPAAWRRDSFGTGLNPILFKFGPQDNSTNVSTTDKPSPNITILRKFGFDTEVEMENSTDVVTEIMIDATPNTTPAPPIRPQTGLIKVPLNPAKIILNVTTTSTKMPTTTSSPATRSPILLISVPINPTNIPDVTTTSTKMPSTTTSPPPTLINSPTNPSSTRSSNRSTTKRTKKKNNQDQKDSNKQIRQTTAQPNRNQHKVFDRSNSEEYYYHHYYYFYYYK